MTEGGAMAWNDRNAVRCGEQRERNEKHNADCPGKPVVHLHTAVTTLWYCATCGYWRSVTRRG